MEVEGFIDSKALKSHFFGASLVFADDENTGCCVIAQNITSIKMCSLSESADFSLVHTGIAICYLIMIGSHPISIYFS
jgi:hypothetical protein